MFGRKSSKNKKEKKSEKKGFKIEKIFYALAPIIGLAFGVIYFQNKDLSSTNIKKDRVYQQYSLTDSEIIEIIEYKLEQGNNRVKDWFVDKVDAELKSKKAEEKKRMRKNHKNNQK